jgi:hypothetical protein
MRLIAAWYRSLDGGHVVFCANDSPPNLDYLRDVEAASGTLAGSGTDAAVTIAGYRFCPWNAARSVAPRPLPGGHAGLSAEPRSTTDAHRSKLAWSVSRAVLAGAAG